MMTYEETIKQLKKCKSFHNGSYGTAIDMAIKALEQQPCEDCISRESLRQKLQEHHDLFVNAYSGFNFKNMTYIDKARVDEIDNCIAMVVNAPSVTPSRPKGKWIQTKDDCDGVNFYDFSFECSKCGKEQSFKSNYCPKCGAYMRESEDE